MSNKEMAMKMIEGLPEEKMVLVISYLDGLYDGLPDIPNEKTIEAMEENDKALHEGSAKKYQGDTDDIFAEILGPASA